MFEECKSVCQATHHLIFFFLLEGEKVLMAISLPLNNAFYLEKNSPTLAGILYRHNSITLHFT